VHASKRGLTIGPSEASAYMIANELGIHFFERIARARAPLSVDARGALTCAASIPEGSMVSILDGEPDNMILAARRAAEAAKAGLEGVPAAGVLLFDCVCRGMILRDDFGREIEAVRAVFGDVPVAGFLTYGEIARRPGNLDGWHNATAVVAAIPAN
jgi:methyl-accepting chemotaxis protein